MSKLEDMAGLGVWLALCFTAAAVGAVASGDAAEFYASLSLPPWAPPASAFAPVWTLLYVTMGVAAWLVWREAGLARGRAALLLFVGQLVLNTSWTWLFFAWRLGAAAFVEIVALWLLILVTAAAFWRVRRLAGALLAPYLVWVGFAAALSFSAWRRNAELLG